MRAERKNLEVLGGAVVKRYGKGIMYSRSYAFVDLNRIPLGREGIELSGFFLEDPGLASLKISDAMWGGWEGLASSRLKTS